MKKANLTALQRIFLPRYWTVMWRLRIGLLAVPVLLIVLAVFHFWITNRVADSYREVTDRIGLVAIRLEIMRSGMEEMESSLRGYIISEGNEDYRLEYEAAARAFEQAYQETYPLTEPTPQVRRGLENLYQLHSQWRQELAEPALVMVTTGRATPEWAATWTQQNIVRFSSLQKVFEEIRRETLGLRQQRVQEANRWSVLSNVSSIVLLTLALALALWLTAGLTRLVHEPLQQVVEHSHRVQSGDYRPFRTDRADEFGRVTTAMNAMALAIESRLEREKLVSRMRATISRSLDWDTVLQTTVNELGQALQASRCFICLWPDESTLSRSEIDHAALVAYEWTAPGVEPFGVGRVAPLPLVLLTQGRQETLISDDVAHDEQLEALSAGLSHELLQSGALALMDTPLWLRGKMIGIIGLHQCDATRRWRPDERELVETVSAHVAIALDNARLFRESIQRQAELETARDALASSSEQLQEKNRELEEFVYTVSHDLKAPIISMQGYLAALLADYGEELDEDARFYIQRATANAGQLQNLIFDLMELSRIGRVHEVWQETDLNALLREVLGELEVQAGARGVQIEVQPDLPTISCERKRIRQVVMNLIDNAIKYSDPVKTNRWIKVDMQETPSEWIFRVRDNGIGIAEEHLEKAFGIFQRVSTSKEPGSGIGLSIVRRTAETHRGRAWAQSPGPGQGTTFFFSISKTGAPNANKENQRPATHRIEEASASQTRE